MFENNFLSPILTNQGLEPDLITPEVHVFVLRLFGMGFFPSLLQEFSLWKISVMHIYKKIMFGKIA